MRVNRVLLADVFAIMFEYLYLPECIYIYTYNLISFHLA